MTSTNLTTLLERVAELDTRPPRLEAVDAIRTLETAVIDALHGESLRGLPNLGTGRSPFVGANLRGGAPDARVAFPKDGQDMGTPTLVLRADGKLAVAWTLRQSWEGPGSMPSLYDFTYRGAEDDDLRVEDLRALLAALPSILTEHLTKIEKTQASFAEVRDLAHRVLDLVPARRVT